MIFRYPDLRTERTHGPVGYSSYKSFRPWLRDEFTFRCVYCLKRETWGQVTGEFELDHFEPQSLAPELTLDYANLVYACRRCNAVKLDKTVEDPFVILSRDSVIVLSDGYLKCDRTEVNRLIMQLDLNSPRLVRWRVMWMRIVDLANQRDTELHRQLTAFPEDLPNLQRLKPSNNLRPEGVELSWYSKRKRGQLIDIY